MFLSAGPRVIKVPTESVLLPKINTGSTTTNVAEAATIAASDIALETVALVMTKFATRTVASSEVLADANPSLRQIVQTDHEFNTAATIDKQLIEGTGTAGQILGLRNQSGITTTTLGGGNGAAVTLVNIADALYRLEAADAKGTALFMHPRTYNSIRQIVDGQSRFQLQPDPRSAAPKELFGVRIFTSSQLSASRKRLEVRARSAATSWRWTCRRIVVGQRDSVQVLIDPFSLSSTDQVVIRSTTRWGLAVLDPEAIQVIAGVKTS